MNSLDYLENDLKRGTFDAQMFLMELPEGLYCASKKVFFNIKLHPTVAHLYRVIVALQQRNTSNHINDNFTIFKSVSRYHLELINGVVIIDIGEEDEHQ